MSTENFVRRLERNRKDVFNATTRPQLPYSAIDGGALVVRDINGDDQAYVGQQWDGTTTVASVGGSTPVSPTVPFVEEVIGGLSLYWDGTYVDGSVSRMDFKRVTFHAVLDVDDFDAVDATQIVGEISIATGGSVYVTLPSVEHFIFAVCWTDAGKFSIESDVAFGTPIPAVDPEMWAGHEDALTELNDVALPGLQADLDANEAALDTLNGIIIPAIEADLTNLSDDLTNLNDVTLPELQADLDDLNGNQAALQAAADAAQADADAALASAATAAEDAADALTAAGIAQAAADGAIRTFGPEEYPTNPPWANGSSQPATVVGDLWLNDGGVAHRWNGTTWYVIPDSAAANALAAAIAAQDLAAIAASDAQQAYLRWAPTGQTTIDGGKLTADSVTAAQIAADTITANEIAADTITANEIAADTITGNEIAADTISTTELNVGDATNLIADGDLLDPAFANWNAGGLTRVPANGADPAYIEWVSNVGNAHRYNLQKFEVAPGDKFYFECEVSTPASNTDPVNIVACIQTSTASGSIYTWEQAFQAMPPNTAWTAFTGVLTIGLGGSVTTGVWDPFLNASVAGQVIRMRRMSLRRMAAGKIIVDGAVIASKIATDAVVAGKVAADAITAREVAADTITANEIAADTITANEMAADSITATELAAGSVGAEHIKVGVLEAGYTLTGQLDVTGSIRVRDSSWSPAGLVFPGSLVLPSVAGGQATINANVTAKSLTVEKDLNILGASNKIAGSLSLANGITTPTVASAAYANIPSIASGINTTYLGPLHYGATSHLTNGNIILFAQAFYGGSVGGFDMTTGTSVYMHDQKPWGTTGMYGFNPYGITTANGYYYVLGVDSARSGWWIYKLNSTFDKVQELGLGDLGAGRPALGTDGGNLLVAVPLDNAVRVYFYNSAMEPASYQTYGFPGVNPSSEVSSVARNVFDYGSMHMMIGVKNIGIVTNVENGGEAPGGTFINLPGGAHMRGNLWKNGRLYTLDINGRWYTHGLNKTNLGVTVSHTWYDGVGTTRQTQESPATSFTIPARSNLVVQTPPPPDSGSSEVNVDKANRVGIYVGADGGARRLQSLLPLASDGVTAVTLFETDNVTTSGATPPATNGFIGGASSPGLITNPAGTLRIEGDGTIDCVSVNNQTISDTGWNNIGYLNGWYTAAGQSAYGPIQYRVKNGICYLRGRGEAPSGQNGAVFAQLPVGARPAMAFSVTQQCGGGVVYLQITSDGYMQFPGNGFWGTWMNVGCSFPVD